MLVKVKLTLNILVESENVAKGFDDALALVGELPTCEATATTSLVDRHSGYGRYGGRAPYKRGGKNNRSEKTCYQLVEEYRATKKAKRP